MNRALVRYVDFTDNYRHPLRRATLPTCLRAVLAAAEYADRNGEDFLAAVAVAYQVFCRLIDEAPGREQGFGRTVQLAMASRLARHARWNWTWSVRPQAIAIAGAAVQELVGNACRLSVALEGSAVDARGAGQAQYGLPRATRCTGPLQVLDG